MKKIFVSYSHKNEDLKIEFLRFLKQLERDGVVQVSHDRLIEVGTKLDEGIRSMIDSSDVIVFLVSQDFLVSEYCMDVELHEGIKRSELGISRIFPIILTHCGWEDSIISEYMLASDGTPLVDNKDHDRVWKEYAKRIRGYCESLDSDKVCQKDSDLPSYSNEFLEFLNSTGAPLSSPHVESVSLDQIYVWSEVKNMSEDISRDSILFSSKKLLESSKGKRLVIGDEQSGKTSFGKMAIRKFMEDGKSVFYMDGASIDRPDPRDVAFRISERVFSVKKHVDRVDFLIIDDFSSIKLSRKYRSEFLRNLDCFCENVIFLSNDDIKYDELLYGSFDSSEIFEILNFGPSLRDELIFKWITAGQEYDFDDQEVNKKRDQWNRHIDSLVLKNVVPPKPIFILIMLQTIENLVQQDPNLSSHGYCYQRLILQAFDRGGIKGKHVESHFNYLSSFSYVLYKSDKTSMSVDEFEDFERSYYSQYLPSNKNVYENLLGMRILRSDARGVSFSYRYIFYYCIGKYISENFSDIGEREVDLLAKSLHVTRNANIIIFLIHHTRDVVLIKKILDVVSGIYLGVMPATLLSSEVSRLNSLTQTAPSIRLENKSSETYRKQRLKKKDERERKYIVEKDSDDLHGNDLPAHLAEIGRSARAIEVIGQIVRNRYGSLKRGDLEALSHQAVGVGLRFMRHFLEEIQGSEASIVKGIEALLEEHYELSDRELMELSLRTYWEACFSVIYSVLAKISANIGSSELTPIIDECVERELTVSNPAPARLLAWLNARILFSESIPKTFIKRAAILLDGNPIAFRLLQSFVVQYIYMNRIDYDDRQWLASELKISDQTQRAILASRTGRP